MKLAVALGIILFLGVNPRSAAQEDQPKRGTIIVSIEGIRGTEGNIKASVFSEKDGFPADYKKAVRIIETEITPDTSIVIRFEDLPYGDYAVALLHDEDGDGRMKTGLFGIPREGYAVSNNVRGKLGPPKYGDAVITLDSELLSISIRIIY